MVQTLPPHTPKKSFTYGIHQGRPVCRVDVVDASGAGHVREERSVPAVVVGDEMPGVVPEGCRLAELLGDPPIGGMARDTHVDTV